MKLPSSERAQTLHKNIESVASGFKNRTISTGLKVTDGTTEQPFA